MAKTNYFLILGLSETADEAAIDAAFKQLTDALDPPKFTGNPRALEQSQGIISRAREAYAALKDPRFREEHRQEMLAQGEVPKLDQLRPFLGHVCVAAGIITYDELQNAISKQTDIDLPLGQILQDKGLLSQTELDGMLMGQKLYSAPSKPLDKIIRRVLALSIIDIDMVKIALIDQRTSFTSLEELLCKRAWIEKSVLDALK